MQCKSSIYILPDHARASTTLFVDAAGSYTRHALLRVGVSAGALGDFLLGLYLGALVGFLRARGDPVEVLVVAFAQSLVVIFVEAVAGALEVTTDSLDFRYHPDSFQSGKPGPIGLDHKPLL